MAVCTGFFMESFSRRLNQWRKSHSTVPQNRSPDLDHPGLLPTLVKAEFRGSIYCIAATRGLLRKTRH